jgi:hypothetical protein
MRIFMRTGLPIIVLAGTAACARPTPGAFPQPQEAAYSRTPGDTLRYRKHSEWSTSFGLAGMPESGRTRYRQDLHLATTFAPDGTARGWVEALRVETRGSDGSRAIQQGDADVIGLSYELAVGPRGIDSILSAPRLAPRWAGMGSHFNGIFPRLPGGALSPGREWTNHGSGERQDSVFVTRYSRAITYRVVGTSKMRGVPVVAVQYDARFEETSRSRRSALSPGLDPYLFPPYQDNTRTVEHGTFYFTPATGRVVRHEWTGESDFSRPSGHVEAAVQHTEYRATLELVSRPRDRAGRGAAPQ